MTINIIIWMTHVGWIQFEINWANQPTTLHLDELRDLHPKQSRSNVKWIFQVEINKPKQNGSLWFAEMSWVDLMGQLNRLLFV